MMAAKRLFILRHAESPLSGSEDFERPLSARGVRQAQALGAAMKQQDLLPDYVVCSPARRTRETYDALERYLPEVSSIFP